MYFLTVHNLAKKSSNQNFLSGKKFEGPNLEKLFNIWLFSHSLCHHYSSIIHTLIFQNFIFFSMFAVMHKSCLLVEFSFVDSKNCCLLSVHLKKNSFQDVKDH